MKWPAMLGGAQRSLGLVLLLGSLSLAAGAQDEQAERGVSGIQRVLRMLSTMKDNAKEEKLEDQVAWKKQEQWCTLRDQALRKEIAANVEELESVEAENERLGTEIDDLDEDISKLAGELESLDSELNKTNSERRAQRLAFVEEEKDFRGSVEALDPAIKKLEAGNKGDSLLQSSAGSLPEEAHQLVASFLESNEGGPPEAAAYEFQSGGIVDMLKKLYDKFKDKLWESQKEEARNKQAYKLLVTDLEASVATAEQDKKAKVALKQRKNQKVAENNRRIKDETAIKEDNQKALLDTKTSCKEKKSEFNEKQKVLSEEMEAIDKASEVISSQVMGSGQKLLEGGGGTSLAALRSSAAARRASSRGVQRQQVRQYLTKQADQLHSQSLSLLVQKLEADPFAKIQKMIHGLIVKLQQEALQDSEEHGYCETELAKNSVTRSTLTERMESLQADIEETKASVTQLSSETASLSDEVQDATAAYYKAAEFRKEEHYRNKATMEEGASAQKAVAQAITILREFYSRGGAALLQDVKPAEGGSAALLQQGAPGRDSGAVVAMLEVVQSDFAKAEADTRAAEQNGKMMFTEMEAQHKEDKMVKEKQIQFNVKEKGDKKVDVKAKADELHNMDLQLDSAKRFLEKLQEKCGVTTGSHAERAAKLEEEIQTLKNALEMFNMEAEKSETMETQV